MNKIFLSLILFSHVFILTKLNFFPYPELFIYPYLTNHGLKPYSQILDQHFPGLMFLPVNFDNLGMTTPGVARIWSIALVVAIQLSLFAIGSKILKSERKALTVNLLYLLWQPFFEGWVLWIDSFLPLFLLLAFYFLYKKNFFLTGIFLGAALVFKQVLILLSLVTLIYVFYESKNTRKIILYFFGLLLPTTMMVLYFLSIGVIKDFWYWTVIFNLTTFAKYGKQTVPSFAHFLRVAVVFAPAILGLAGKDKRVVKLLLIFLIGALPAALARFDFVHFQPALPFVILATVYGLDRLKFKKLVWIGYVLVLIWWLPPFYKGYLGNKVLFFDAEVYELAAKINQLVTPGEKIFIFGAPPHLYQMTKTKPAGDIFVFQFPWFFMIAEDRILEGIKKDKPEIIVSDRTVIIERVKIIDFAAEIDQYIGRSYQKIDSVGTTDILRREN